MLWVVVGMGAVITFVVAPLLMRVVATLHGVCASPKHAINNISKNWWAQIACLDSAHPPEVLPGAILFEEKDKRISELQPYGYLLAQMYSIRKEIGFYNRLKRTVFVFATSLGYLTASIPAYMFRWSIKGTSVLLLPLIWLVYDSQKAKPEHIIKSTFMKSLFRVSTAICFIAIGVVSMKVLGADFGLAEPLVRFLKENDYNESLLQLYIVDEVAIWQIFLVASSATTVVCFLSAERLSNRGYSEHQLNVYRHSLSLLGFFAVCTIFALVYQSASMAVSG
jgi:hypothetical protein